MRSFSDRCGSALPPVGGIAFLALLAVVLALLGLGGDAARDLLALDRDAVLSGEIYRVLTAHLVQLTPHHLMFNLLGIPFVLAVILHVVDARGLALASLVSALAVSLGLLVFSPELTRYEGFSGVTHGLFAWGGLQVLARGPRWYGCTILATLGAKLLWEQTVGPTPGAEAAIGGHIVLDSHLFGAAGGALAWALPHLRRLRGFLPHLRRLSWLWILASVAVLRPDAALAHRNAVTEAVIARGGNGDAVLTIRTEAAAFALQQPLGPLSDRVREDLAAMPDADLSDYIDGSGAFLLSRIRLVTEDGREIAATRVGVPTVGAMRRYGLDPGANPAPLYRLIFPAPPLRALDRVALRMPRRLGAYHLVVDHPRGGRNVIFGFGGIPTEAFPLDRPASLVERVSDYLAGGFSHVVPFGWDHAMFVASLALVASSVWAAAIMASTFTVAHSVTLSLAALGIVRPPASAIEIGIAASIAAMGAANAMAIAGGRGTAGTESWRLGLIFSFGLLHGLGFARVFLDLNLDGVDLALALASFNIGIEFGQIVVLVVVWVVLTRGAAVLLGDRAGMATRVAACAGVAGFGILWTAERFAGVI